MVPEPNDLVEVSVTEDIRAILYRYYKSRAAEATSKLHEVQNEKTLTDFEQKQLEDIIGKENVDRGKDHLLEDSQSESDDEEPTETKSGFGQSLLSSKGKQ